MDTEEMITELRARAATACQQHEQDFLNAVAKKLSDLQSILLRSVEFYEPTKKRDTE